MLVGGSRRYWQPHRKYAVGPALGGLIQAGDRQGLRQCVLAGPCLQGHDGRRAWPHRAFAQGDGRPHENYLAYRKWKLQPVEFWDWSAKTTQGQQVLVIMCDFNMPLFPVVPEFRSC